VYAGASSLVDPAIGKAGDVDTAVVTLTCASGRIAVITNSRRATYGYDQRIEVHGSKGMVAAGNVLENSMAFYGSDGVTTAKPMFFFLERYAPAYAAEFASLMEALKSDATLSPSGDDGYRSLALAEAALASLKSGAAVSVG
jgi:myo-inositol 2-dehydrogenase/D-chiro-inositol 1-dehydrogenase